MRGGGGGGEREDGANARAGALSKQLKVPQEPRTARCSLELGQQHGEEGPEQPLRCSPALLTGPGPWPAWL